MNNKKFMQQFDDDLTKRIHHKPNRRHHTKRNKAIKICLCVALILAILNLILL